MTMDHANDTDPAVFAAVLTELKNDARTPVKKVCFTSACYRNGASAYSIFITVMYVQAPP